jgi:hypothetical protein
MHCRIETQDADDSDFVEYTVLLAEYGPSSLVPGPDGLPQSVPPGGMAVILTDGPHASPNGNHAKPEA